MNPLHYPDLERCKKLTEIGFPKTEYAYQNSALHCRLIDDNWDIRINKTPYYNDPNWITVAYCPSIAEMLDVIPMEINWLWFEIEKLTTTYTVRYIDSWRNFSDTLPNALADLIIWLHENKYINF